MPFIKSDRFLKTIRREPVDATPVWIMRQAGRYLPEYRATRAKAGSFLRLCKTPELACEVTLQPLQRYPLDASIIFSDILTIPDAMGLGLEVRESEGPVFTNPLTSALQIQRLEVPDPEKLAYVYSAINLVSKELAGNLPLIGFCGSPWTLAAYMLEGKSKQGFNKVFTLMQENPALLHSLLATLAQAVSAHLNAQIEAGVQAVMIFDTWGGLLTTPQYETFSLTYMQEVIAGLAKKNNQAIPTILFTKGGKHWLEQIATTGCDVIGLDWEVSLQEAKSRVGNQVALQGNMNPSFLLKSPDIIQTEAANILASFGKGSGHVFNLGHGITPDVPPEHVAVLIDAIHHESKKYHV